MSTSGYDTVTAAARRRQRRLRAYLRCARMSVATALADECRTRCGSRTAAKRATTARCLEARAAVDRHGPGRVVAPYLKGSEVCQGRGGGARGARRVTTTEAPSPAGALLQLYEVEPGGSRPPTGADPAAHHGAACRRRAHGSGP